MYAQHSENDYYFLSYLRTIIGYFLDFNEEFVHNELEFTCVNHTLGNACKTIAVLSRYRS